MSATVLGNITLGYRLLWNRQRLPATVELFVDADAQLRVDARHLLATLDELWPQTSTLLLSIRNQALLRELLTWGSADSPRLRVPHTWLGDPALATLIRQAHDRGLRMVWYGPPGQQPDAADLPQFRQLLLRLSAEESAQLLAGLPPARPAGTLIYEGLASRALAAACLDQLGAWAVAGWPGDDTVHSLATQAALPGRSSLDRLLAAIAADASLETMEVLLESDPVLFYRFLQHLHTQRAGLRADTRDVRHGMMMLGHAALRTWLQQQQASDAPDLQPVRTQIVTRAHLMNHLLEAGEEDELRHEIYLCGLLSQFERLLGRPLAELLQDMPVSERIEQALVQGSGPYFAALDLARALESTDTHTIHALCELHEMPLEDVNRALLRTLATGLVTPERSRVA